MDKRLDTRFSFAFGIYFLAFFKWLGTTLVNLMILNIIILPGFWLRAKGVIVTA